MEIDIKKIVELNRSNLKEASSSGQEEEGLPKDLLEKGCGI